MLRFPMESGCWCQMEWKGQEFYISIVSKDGQEEYKNLYMTKRDFVRFQTLLAFVARQFLDEVQRTGDPDELMIAALESFTENREEVTPGLIAIMESLRGRFAEK